MKSVFFLFLLTTSILTAQVQDIEIIEERGENTVLLYAQNNTDDELDITFRLESTGFLLSEKSPINKLLAPKAKQLLITLTAPKGVACEYSSGISYKKVKKAVSASDPGRKNRMTSVQMNTTKINVFTQDGCGRCEYVIKYLEDMKIPFVELNTTIHDPNQALMFDKLQEAGFKGNSVQMPVVVHNGKTEYNIKDLAAWAKKLKN